jgi:hypothetical protein
MRARVCVCVCLDQSTKNARTHILESNRMLSNLSTQLLPPQVRVLVAAAASDDIWTRGFVEEEDDDASDLMQLAPAVPTSAHTLRCGRPNCASCRAIAPSTGRWLGPIAAAAG